MNQTAVAVTAKYWPLNFIYALFKPVLVVDGRQVPAVWGRTVVPVPPGQHHVHIHVPYMLPPRIGIAESVVPVYPGQVVEVEYRPPAIAWLGGSIGPPPQKVRGMGASIAIAIVSVVLLLCVFGVIIAAAVSDSGDSVALGGAVTSIATGNCGRPESM